MEISLRKLAVALALALLILTLGLPPSHSAREVRVIVTVDKKSLKRASVSKLGGIVVKEYKIIPTVLVELSEHAVKDLKKLPGVVRVEYDGIVRALGARARGKPQPPQAIPWGY